MHINKIVCIVFVCVCVCVWVWDCVWVYVCVLKLSPFGLVSPQMVLGSWSEISLTSLLTRQWETAKCDAFPHITSHHALSVTYSSHTNTYSPHSTNLFWPCSICSDEYTFRFHPSSVVCCVDLANVKKSRGCNKRVCGACSKMRFDVWMHDSLCMCVSQSSESGTEEIQSVCVCVCVDCICI